MRILIAVSIISSFCFLETLSADAHWSYAGDEGPNFWPAEYCSGKKQSPVNIEVDGTVYDEYLKDIDPIVVKEGTTMKLGNNGHAVYLKPESQVHMSGGGLEKDYFVAGPHFHWGIENRIGSEHTVDKKAFPLEMHIVTYNAESFADAGAAIKSGESDALAVFGVFFEIGAENNTEYQPIIEQLSAVTKAKGAEVDVTLSIKQLMPPITEDYYRYQGSLTTPTCNEVVVWTLFRNPVTISQYQMDQFRSVLDTNDEALVNNYRPTQPLNGRVVYRSFRVPLDDMDGGASVSTVSYICVTMAAIFSLKFAEVF